MVVVCLVVADALPVKRSTAGKSCRKSKGTINLYDAIPTNINDMTCHDTNDCFSAFASVMVFNTTSKKMDSLDVVVACIKRVPCLHGKKDIKKSHKVDASKSYTVFAGCNKAEDEISIVLPRWKNGALTYEKVVYDCRCPCSKI